MNLSAVIRNNSEQKTSRTLVIFLFFSIYFAFYAMFGSRGFYQMLRLEDQLRVSEMQLTSLRQNNQELSQKVALMRPNNLDMDMLDEQARRVLNYVHPDDVVINYQ